MAKKSKDQIIAELQSEIKALNGQLNTFNDALRKMPGNIYWISVDGQVLGCNTNVAKSLGLETPEEVVGKFTHEIMEPSLAQEIRKMDLEVLRTETEKTIEETAPPINGKPQIYLSRKSPFYDNNGKLVGILGISVNITQQKETERKLKVAKQRAEMANRAKSKFLAMINHELRMPLTSILGFSNFLQKEGLTLEQQREYTQYIVQSGSYLLALVNQILDYTKISSGKAPVHLTTINIKRLILDVIEILQGTAIVKNLPVHFKYGEDIPAFIKSDTVALQHILVNLISNAIKFTHEGCITVNLNCIEKTVDRVKLEITVKDTGIGIPSRKLKSIFKEFYQVEDIYERSQSMIGAGLGLTIVKKLVNQLNGKIHVSSKPNQGSTFSFIANYTIAMESDAQHKVSDISYQNNNDFLAATSVLLVEDDPLVQIIHKQMLSNFGCKVDIADCARKALELYNHKYNMIFVDVGLPDINGFKLIKELRKKGRAAKRVPIIALTGFSSAVEQRQCINSGADSVLIKPVHSDQLKEVLKQFLININ